MSTVQTGREHGRTRFRFRRTLTRIRTTYNSCVIHHRIRYRVIDEDGLSVGGVTVGPETLEEFRDQLEKRFHHQHRFIYLEHMGIIEVIELTEEEQALLRGEEID